MNKSINIVEILGRDLKNAVGEFRTNCQNRLVIEREVLPIIFVPGIMGSRLGISSTDKRWDPDDLWFMFTNFGRRKTDAAWKRAELVGNHFDPGYLQVLNSDAEHNERFADGIDTTREERGWGGVSWNSYGEFLRALQNRQWDQTVDLFYEFPV